MPLELRLAWRNVWRNPRRTGLTVAATVFAVVLVVFFVVLMPSLPFILKTEGSLKSQVQIVFSYSLVLAQVLLSLLAVFLCTASLCSEIERRHVQITDTKPLPRWTFLLGKLVGVVVLCAGIMFLMAGSATAETVLQATTKSLRPCFSKNSEQLRA